MKKFKTRKKNKIYIIIITIIITILFIVLSFMKINKSYDSIVKLLISDFTKDKTISSSILTSNLDYLLNTYSFKEDLVYHQKNNKIYLYNTHNLEKYCDNTTIYNATNLLKNNLTKLGITVIQEDKKPSELLSTGLSYYNISRLFIKDVMSKEKDIAYYIDIHRDSIKDTTITINNKKYAKIMFVLGLDNKNYQENKIVMEKMNNYLNTNYPGLSRGIYEKKSSDGDGIYNQDLNSNVLLIEIGGVENNIEEVNNSTEIIALMLYHMTGD